MVVKFCSRSHGHPVSAVRSAAIISIRRPISRDGVMAVMSARCLGALGHEAICYQALVPRCKLFTAPASVRRRMTSLKLSVLAAAEMRRGSEDGGAGSPLNSPSPLIADSHKRYYGIFFVF